MSGRDEIAARLSTASEVVEAAGLPDDLRAAGFTYALAALEGGMQSSVNVARPEADNSLLSKIATRLGLSLDVVTAIFEESGEQIQLIVPKAKLPHKDSKAASMRDIALLLAAGRQAAELEEFTPLSFIRSECDELGVLDLSNFSAEIGRLGMRTQGGRNSREVRASRHQLEEAAELMGRIANG